MQPAQRDISRAGATKINYRAHWADVGFAALLVFVMSAVCIAFSVSRILDGMVLLPGSSVNGIDLSGQEPRNAQQYLIEKTEEDALSKIAFVVEIDGVRRTFNGAELGASTNASQMIVPPLNDTLEGGALSRAEAYYHLQRGIDADVRISYDKDVLRASCKEYASAYYKPPADAAVRMTKTGGGVEFIQEKEGVQVNEEKLANAMLSRLAQGDFSTLKWETETLYPAIISAQIKNSIAELASCTTDIQAGDAAVLSELLANLNGVILYPEHTLSLRRQLYNGQEMPEQDVQIATQVASTYYNAALVSGLNTTQRHAAQRPQSYIAMGLEAWLDHEKDLVMDNPHGDPLFVLAGQHEDKLTIRIYGKVRRLDENLRIGSTVDRTIAPAAAKEVLDTTLAKGKRTVVTAALDGYRVTSYRETLRNGRVINHEALGQDQYDPIQEVVNVGPSG